jgi:hypothetical protein
VTSPGPTQLAVSNLPKNQTLNLQANHPNGTTLRMTGITFHEDNLEVHLIAINGNPDINNVELSYSDRMDLIDDVGIKYRLSPPPANPTVKVAKGSTLEGTFVFLGRVNPQANRLTLVTNDGICCSSDTSSSTNSPEIRIEIPLQR